MIAKLLIAVGFLFLLVVAGPTIIEWVTALLQAGQTIKDSVKP